MGIRLEHLPAAYIVNDRLMPGLTRAILLRGVETTVADASQFTDNTAAHTWSFLEPLASLLRHWPTLHRLDPDEDQEEDAKRIAVFMDGSTEVDILYIAHARLARGHPLLEQCELEKGMYVLIAVNCLGYNAVETSTSYVLLRWDANEERWTPVFSCLPATPDTILAFADYDGELTVTDALRRIHPLVSRKETLATPTTESNT